MTRFAPRDSRELADVVAAAVAREEPLEIVAGGSKRALGRPPQLPHVLDLGAFSGIRLYEPEELVLTAGAATPLAEIEAALAARHQMLAFEPPEWRALLGSPSAKPTIGGVIACNLAGPRRIRQGAARDHFLGFSAVSGRGEAFKAGGRVVKNVTGYDLPKLMAGSFGTLAALTEVTLKVLPAPEATETLVLLGLDDAAAQRAMGRALQSPHEVSGAAHLPASSGAGARTLVRIEGHAPSVAARSAALAAALAAMASVERLGGEGALALWRGVRELEPLAPFGDRALWRISVPPVQGPRVAAEIAARHDTRHFFDWGGGLVCAAVAGAADGGATAIRAALGGEGHATLIRAPDALRAAVEVFEPQPPALAALTARVKLQFDPRRILNRGRMHRDL